MSALPGPNEIPIITPRQYKALVEAGEPFILIDLRQAFEREISVLPNDVHIPAEDLSKQIANLDKNALIILYCRTGGRSGIATQVLRAQGFAHAYNFATGINGYAREFDSRITIY